MGGKLTPSIRKKKKHSHTLHTKEKRAEKKPRRRVGGPLTAENIYTGGTSTYNT